MAGTQHQTTRFTYLPEVSFEEAAALISDFKALVLWFFDHPVYWENDEILEDEQVQMFANRELSGPIFNDFVKELKAAIRLFAPLMKNDKVNIYRTVRVNNVEQFDISEPGVCWACHPGKAIRFNQNRSKDAVLVTATVPKEDINWLASVLFQACNAEYELRLYSSDRVDITKYSTFKPEDAVLGRLESL